MHRILFLVSLLPVLALFSLVALFPFPALAKQHLITRTAGGSPLFYFDIYDKGEKIDPEDDDEPASAWTIGPKERFSLTNASDYWAAVLRRSAANSRPVPMSVTTADYANAFAGSSFIVEHETSDYIGRTEVMLGILHDWPGDGAALGEITLGFPGQGYHGPMEALTHNGAATHITSALVHELGHALGILSGARNVDGSPAFGSFLSKWDEHLYDAFGTKAKKDMYIVLSDEGIRNDFVLDAQKTPYAFFRGDETMKVVGKDTVLDHSGATGVPVTGMEGSWPDFSHPELKNSMMSHQPYRNWTSYMEAELAMLKDIGFTIDLRDFYGRSIYDSGSVVENSNGYFARNSEGTAYLPGVYNNTPLGVGLHIYGARNTVVQAADILSSGFGGAGIRMDGSGFESDDAGGRRPVFGQNHLTVAPGVRVHSHGERGTGLMVSYGKGHVVINQGEIAALGAGGVGARFDFGDSLLGDSIEGFSEYRGSYIYASRYHGVSDKGWDALEQEGLDGALVARFDLTGVLAGREAALLIAENAQVEEVNVMRGAFIAGDIISRWDPQSPMIHERAATDGLAKPTLLTFGYAPDADGEIAFPRTPDSAFSLRYRGNVLGRKSLDLQVAGGRLDYAGRMAVRSFELLPAAAMDVFWTKGFRPTLINADAITLSPGSSLGFAYDGRLLYGPETARGDLALLLLNAPSLENAADLRGSSGVLHVGPYDYSYAGPTWKGPGELGLTILDKRFNHERGGTSAVTAPLAMLAHNQGVRTVWRQMTLRFSQGRAEAAGSSAMAFLGEHIPGVSFGEYGPSFARDAAGRRLSGQEQAALARSERGVPEQPIPVQTLWNAASDGGGALRSHPFSLWATPGYTYTHQNGVSNYDIFGPSLVFGGDGRFGDRCFAGAAVAFDFPRYEADYADIDGRSVTGILYGGALLPWNLELGLTAAYGKTNYDQRRTVLGKTYDSDYDSSARQAGVSLGRPFGLGESFALRPFVSYEYLHLDTNGYKEKTDSLSLRFRPSDNSLHRVEAGADAAVSFENGAYLTGRAYYAGLHGDRSGKARIAFTADPDRNSFVAHGDSLDADSLGLGLGAGMPITEHFEITGVYNFLGGKDSATHQGALGVVMRF